MTPKQERQQAQQTQGQASTDHAKQRPAQAPAPQRRGEVSDGSRRGG